MARIHANGIDIDYEEFGPKAGSPVLLIMGLGAQLTCWPLEKSCSRARKLLESGIGSGFIIQALMA